MKGKQSNMNTAYSKLLAKDSTKKILPISIVLVIFGLIGIYLLVRSYAATPTASVEIETGTIAGPVTRVSDSSASGGSAIKFGAATSTNPQTTLLSINFDDGCPGSPSLCTTVSPTSTSLRQKTLVSDGTSPGKFYRQTLPARTENCDALPTTTEQQNCRNKYLTPGGFVYMTQLPQSVTEASIQYNVRFANNPDGSTFEWKSGGKLPGLGGIAPGESPGAFSGCTNPTNPNGWSGRGMWNGPPATSKFETGKDNGWIGYMYTYRKANAACGEGINPYKAFTVNKWHTVKQYYKLNTITNGVPDANGVHKMWLDGVLIRDVNTYLYRNSTTVPINYLYWSIFRGGASSSLDSVWTSTRPGIVDIDSVTITSPGL